MLHMLLALESFFTGRIEREEGATAVEYGLMVALIAIVIIVGVRAVGVNLLAVFQNIAANLVAVN